MLKKLDKLYDFKNHPYRSFFLSLPILALFPLFLFFAIISTVFYE